MTDKFPSKLERWRESPVASTRLAAKLWDDVTDRRGIKWEFTKCDDDVKCRILNRWKEIIKGELSQ